MCGPTGGSAFARAYRVEARILKAEEYGVPQERRRLVFVGNRIGVSISWPERTHGPELLPRTSAMPSQTPPNSAMAKNGACCHMRRSPQATIS